MSYNITDVKTIKIDACMVQSDLLRLYRAHKTRLPEGNFLTEHKRNEAVTVDGESLIKLSNFWWCGEGSGYAYELLFETIAPQVRGLVEVVFVWEGGDSLGGLRIKNGKVTEHEVLLCLGKRTQ